MSTDDRSRTGGTLVSAPQQEAPPAGVLDRGLFLLHLFTAERNRMQLRELSDLSGLDKSTTLRALRSLAHWGFLERHSDGSYSPGPMNLRLAAIFKETSTLISRVERPLNAVAEQVNQSASFFIRAGDQRVCMSRCRKRASHTNYVELGTSVPLDHGGSAAKILLAFTGGEALGDVAVRENGYAASRGERLRHFTSISIPLFDSDQSFLGAITISGLSTEISDEDLHSFAAIAKKEFAQGGFDTGINK
ncbi:IclR family transcriptional regulator [Rhizobium panacihumi]|uniref:IclR family transcriptional regulator n=1 Tax=Rhizobium panacihumi TaxID=2008450 RepID=UPI003D7980E9